MRAGMYNRWLSTLGGGEKESLAIAERISQYFPIDVISHKPVSKEYAAERLNLDLSRVRFLVIPEQTTETLPPLTREYDLFINSSFMDFFPSLAKRSASLIWFPAQLNWQIAVRRGIKKILRDGFHLPEMIFGVHRFELVSQTVNWYTEPLVKIRLPSRPQSYRFSFRVARLDDKVHDLQVSLDDEPVSLVQFEGGKEEFCEIIIPAGGGGEKHELLLAAPGLESGSGQPLLRFNHINLSLPANGLYRQLLSSPVTKQVAHKLNFYPPAYSLLEYLKTYDVLWTCSEYSRRWIRRYWNCDSEVLYPPVDVETIVPLAKKPQILNVGRFFAGSHNKKHLEMVSAFRKMVDDGLTGWELHLAGGTMVGKEHDDYLASVRQAVEGYPIYLHTNAPINELVRLYGESAIYWHASGYGEDENRSPEKFEHFGITTVEAMAGGCCPVVIGKGGQLEIVQHGKDGLLWHSLEDLQALTWKLIRDEELRDMISRAAHESSLRFNRSHFNEQVDLFLKQSGLL